MTKTNEAEWEPSRMSMKNWLLKYFKQIELDLDLDWVSWDEIATEIESRHQELLAKEVKEAYERGGKDAIASLVPEGFVHLSHKGDLRLVDERIDMQDRAFVYLYPVDIKAD